MGGAMAGTFMAVALSVACAAPPDPQSPGSWRLEEGGTLGSIYAASDTGVVLLLDPSQCFSCTSLLSQWLGWRAENPDRFSLVLSRSPQEWERPRLAPIPVFGTLSVSPLTLRELPVELVFSRSKAVYRSPGLLGVSTSELLAGLRGATLEQALEDVSALRG